MSAQTVTARRPAPPVTGIPRDKAMRFYAAGRTAGEFRRYAADPAQTEALARRNEISIAAARDELLDVAAGIETVAAVLAPDQAYFALGLDEVLGAFPGTVARTLQVSPSCS